MCQHTISDLFNSKNNISLPLVAAAQGSDWKLKAPLLHLVVHLLPCPAVSCTVVHILLYQTPNLLYQTYCTKLQCVALFLTAFHQAMLHCTSLQHSDWKLKAPLLHRVLHFFHSWTSPSSEVPSSTSTVSLTQLNCTFLKWHWAECFSCILLK